MANWLNSFRSFWAGGAISEHAGHQFAAPSMALVPETRSLGADGALQIAAIWACIDRRATTVASLPFFAYDTKSGQKTLARTSRLYSLLHESPNNRMTPFEFWRAMMMNHDLRGNGYARIDRDASGEAYALWPMPADQVTPVVLSDGSMVYEYQLGSDVAVIAAANVLHLKNLGNGTVGLAKLDFMGGTTDEITKAQANAARVFGTGGKPTGVLMVDSVLKPEQRGQIQKSFGEMATGSTSRLYVLEANMKYQQLSISPEDQQLLATRQFSIEEICRWFDMPPVLIHHANVTTWGSGIYQIVDGWHKLSVRPMCVGIEQAVRKSVMTAGQRAGMTAEFSMDALLRGNLSDRMDIYSKALQNGVITISEARQLEGWPYIAGTDGLNVQSNLVPLAMLGKQVASGGDGSPIAQ